MNINKKILSIIIIVSLLLVNNGMFLLANSIDNVETTDAIVSMKNSDDIDEIESLEEEIESEEEIGSEVVDKEEFESEEVDEEEIESEEVDEEKIESEEVDEEEIESENIDEDEIEDDNLEVEEINKDETVKDEISEEEVKKADLFGAPADSETIILDFGDGPGIENSSFKNIVDIFDKNGNKYSITRTGGTIVTTAITGDNVLTESFGLGEHVILPAMDDDVVWDGYKFDGWVDNDNNVVTTFKYAFQYAGQDTTYTALWTPDESKKYTLKKIINIINDDSSITNISTVDEEYNADESVISVISQIQGYRLSQSNITITNAKKRSWTEEKGHGSINISEPISYNEATMMFKGNMPNDDVTVTCNFVSTKNNEFEFKINYINTSGAEINDTVTTTFSAGDKKTANPINITGYVYNSLTVDSGTSVDADLGIFPLGTIDGENYICNSTTGAFSAIMPNQDVEITYVYETNANYNVSVTISQILEGTTNPINTTVTIPYSKISEDQTVDIINRESEGYGIPEIRAVGSVILGTYDDSTGKQLYTVEDADGGTIKIIYSIDYSLPYWSKITYTYSSHGTIRESEGSPALTNRYVSTGNHTLQELVKDITITPEENFVFDGWYMGLTVGVGKTGSKLSNTQVINVTSAMTLYANFIENSANFIDVTFVAGANGTFTANYAPQHLLKNTTWGEITKPTCTPNVGYVFTKWVDSSGNTPADTTVLTISTTYTAIFSLDLTDDGVLTKPVCKVSFAQNGYATAKIIGPYSERKYVLTDVSGVVENILTGDQAVNNTFTNLYPGMIYNVYEVLKTVTINKGDNISAVSSSDKSDNCSIGIKSLNTNWSKTTDEIKITPVSGVSYALIDNAYNVKYNFTTNPKFQGLNKDNSYIVVAKKTSSAGNEIDFITQGVIINTSNNDTSNRTFKLILIDATAANLTSISTGSANVYEVKKGTQVRIQGSAGRIWEVVAGNLASINKNSVNQTITMPQSDLVLVNRTNDISNASIVIEKDSDVGLRNYNDVLSSLYNRESNIDKEKGVVYYLTYDKKPLSYENFMNLSETDKTNYFSYTVGITLGRTVLGVNRPLVTGSYESLNMETSYIFDNSAIDNSGYRTRTVTGTGISSGSIESDYDTGISSGLMSTYFNINYSNRKGYSYKKMYNINVKSDKGLVYNENFQVAKGEKLVDSTNYSSLQAVMTDYRDDSAVDATTGSFGSKKYIYNGIKYNNADYDVNQAVNQQMDLKLEFALDEARETAKTNLNNAIVALENKINSFTADISEEDVATVSELQRVSIELRNSQYDKTVEELVDGYNLIIKVINDFGGAVKPANNGGSSGNNSGSGSSGSKSSGRNRGGSGGGGGGGGGFANVQVQMEPVKLAVDPNDDVTLSNSIFDNQVTTIVNQATYVSTSNGDFIIAPSITYPGEVTLQFHFYDDTRDTPKDTWMNVKFYDEYGIEHTRTYRMDVNGQTKIGWHIENNRLYYFSEKPSENFGSLQYGWIKNPSTGNWYYANKTNGTILTGWQNIDGKYYYFADNDVLTKDYLDGKKTISAYGKLYMNTITPDGHLVDADGALIRYTP